MVRSHGLRVGLTQPRFRGTGGWPAVAVSPSVAAMVLIRGLVSPRTWLAFIHHVAGLIVAIVVFVVVVTGLALSVGRLPLALAGLPVLGVTVRFAGLAAVAERARFGLLLGIAIPAWPPRGRSDYRWLVVPRRGVLTAVSYTHLTLPTIYSV